MNNFSHITQLKIFKTCEYNPDQLDNSLMENEHEVCSQLKNSNLMISREKMECCKVRQIHLYHVPNQLLYPENCSSCVAFIFFAQRWKRIAVSFSSVVSKQVPNVEPYGDLAFRFILNLMNLDS